MCAVAACLYAVLYNLMHTAAAGSQTAAVLLLLRRAALGMEPPGAALAKQAARQVGSGAADSDEAADLELDSLMATLMCT